MNYLLVVQVFVRTPGGSFLLRRGQGCIADAHLATHLLNARAQLGLLQRKGDLILSELALLHDMLLAQIGPSSCRSFCYLTVRKPGTGSPAPRARAWFIDGLRSDLLCGPAAGVHLQRWLTSTSARTVPIPVIFPASSAASGAHARRSRPAPCRRRPCWFRRSAGSCRPRG